MQVEVGCGPCVSLSLVPPFLFPVQKTLHLTTMAFATATPTRIPVSARPTVSWVRGEGGAGVARGAVSARGDDEEDEERQKRRKEGWAFSRLLRRGFLTRPPPGGTTGMIPLVISPK